LVLASVAVAQDCSSVFSGTGKRFLWDDLNNLPKELRAILPRNTEIDRKCRFDLTNLQDSQKATIKTLYDQGYPMCVGCGFVNSDHGRCHSVDVCAKGSVCISGLNKNRIPSYYMHGCCNPRDSECATRDETVTIHVSSQFNPPLTYSKTRCNTPLCNENGYTDEKNALINFLTNASPVTSKPATAAPSAVDGGWTNWSNWGSCDKSCDIGARYRTRACTQPIPQNGGASCDGSNKELDICNAFACP